MIYVVGPEGSGTNLLTDLLRAMGCEAQQRSLPYAGVWWVGADGLFDPATWGDFEEPTWVAITRDAYCTNMSVLRRHLAPSYKIAEQHRKMALWGLCRLDAYRVRYEDLVADRDAVMGAVAVHLGIPMPSALPEVRDENAKWLS